MRDAHLTRVDVHCNRIADAFHWNGTQYFLLAQIHVLQFYILQYWKIANFTHIIAVCQGCAAADALYTWGKNDFHTSHTSFKKSTYILLHKCASILRAVNILCTYIVNYARFIWELLCTLANVTIFKCCYRWHLLPRIITLAYNSVACSKVI